MATTTYGSTYTDLQAGLNAALALDIQRANAQDAANTARAVAGMSAGAQKADSASRQRSAMAQLLSQQQEGAAERKSRMDLETQRAASSASTSAAASQSLMERERLRSETEKEITKMQLERSATAFDPRAFSTIAEIDALNNEKQQKFEQAKRLSAARKQWTGRLGAEQAKAGWGGAGSPDKNVIAEAEAAIKSIDTQAAALEMGLAPDQNGGFLITPPTLIRIPAMLNRGAVAPAQAAVVPDYPPMLPPEAVAPSQSWMVDPASIPAGNPNPIAPPPMFAPRPRLRFDAFANDFVQ